MKLFSSDIGHLTYHSKRLSYLLRHSKLPNHKGWIKVGVVQNELGVLLLDIQKIVYEDTKGRFEFSEDKSSVRALYGHSIDVNLGLEPTTPPPVLYHGTAEKYIEGAINVKALDEQEKEELDKYWLVTFKREYPKYTAAVIDEVVKRFRENIK